MWKKVAMTFKVILKHLYLPFNIVKRKYLSDSYSAYRKETTTHLFEMSGHKMYCVSDILQLF